MASTDVAEVREIDVAWHRLTRVHWDGEAYDVLVSKDWHLMIVRVFTFGSVSDDIRASFMTGMQADKFDAFRKVIEGAVKVTAIPG